MITYEDAKKKLEQLAARFDEAVRQKDWYKAKFIYNKALTIGTFLELSEEDKDWLWGYGKEDVNGNVYFEYGLFNRERVRRMEEACVKSHIETRDYPLMGNPIKK